MQVRIVVAAHGPFAAALKASAEMICGALPEVVTVGLEPDDSPESFRDRLLAAAGDPARPLLILTDLVGGTPNNVALVLARDLPHAAVVSGINLAVLLEVAIGSPELDQAAIDALVAVGRAGLVDATRRPAALEA